jgi:exodeoxyribonuclease-3
MLMVALNIQHGAGKRVGALLEWLHGRSPDLAILSEWRANQSGAMIVKDLVAAGYYLAAQPGTGTPNGILIGSRMPFVSRLDLTPISATAGQLILVSLAEFDLIGAYFPNHEAKQPFFSACHEAALARQGRPLLLIGDLNTGDNNADLTPGGVPFLCAAEFESLRNSGLVDLWRSQHGPEAREYTWSTTKNDFRIDHALANAPFIDRLGPIDCQYDHQTRGARLSDHSALIVRTRAVDLAAARPAI